MGEAWQAGGGGSVGGFCDGLSEDDPMTRRMPFGEKAMRRNQRVKTILLTLGQDAGVRNCGNHLISKSGFNGVLTVT